MFGHPGRVSLCSLGPSLAVRLLAAAFLVVPSLILTPCRAEAVEVGDPAPSFVLSDQNGQSWSLEALTGRIVVLFFLGHNANVCVEAGRQLQSEVLERYSSRGVHVLGIDCWDGSPEQATRFARESGATFPILLMGSQTAASYDVPYHSFVVIDALGTVRAVRLGPGADSFDLSAIDREIRTLLQEASSITEGTWGAIKALYNRKRPVT